MGNRRFGLATMVAAALVYTTRPAAAQVNSPDLIMDQQLLASQVFVSEEQFAPKSCTVVEGVVSKPGKQLVLRFNSSTPNVGTADLYIGDPNQYPTLFEFSECHQHLHLKDYTAYRLWTEAGYATWVAQRDPGAPTNSGINAQLLAAATTNGDLISGHKQGFCMVDSAPYLAGAGPAKYLSCSSNQGISIGWEDVYPPQLPDQFIQITGLAEGDYVLENQVNPNQLLLESNYANNFAAVKLHYTSRHGNTPASIQTIP